jgi:hypothetical protein
MPQTIQEFYRVARERGFSRDYMLRVLEIGDTRFDEDDFLYITTKNLPGRNISNQTAPYMGLVFNVPGTATYPGSEAWSVTFRNDIEGLVRSKLEAWQRNDIFDDQTSVGDLNVPGEDRVITLELVDDQLQTRSMYQLYGVYCQGIAPVEGYDNTGPGALTTFNVSLAYQYWLHPIGPGVA